MKATATVPVRVGAAPVVLGAKNARTDKRYDWPGTAFEQASPGDTILVFPGLSPANIYISVDQLTIRSAVSGGRYIFDVGGKQVSVIGLGKGISLTLEDFELRNNKKEYANAAGIWPEGGKYTLTLRRGILHDLNNGILVGQHPEATVLLEDMEVYDCGDYQGYGHNIYAGEIASFTMRRSLSTMRKARGDPGVPNWDISWGHLVKSRAAMTLVEDCRLYGGRGESNRCIDLPNGGDVTIRRNQLEFRTPQNFPYGQFISYGVEENYNAAHHPLHRLTIEDNILVDRMGGETFTLWIDNTPPTVYSVKRNTFAGGKQPSIKDVPAGSAARWAIDRAQNKVVQLADFVDVDRYDWRLK